MARVSSNKIKPFENLVKILAQARKKGKKIVLCHGVFDLLHPGHIKHFETAKKKGDVLVVTITKDEYVNKGPGRPVFSEFLRAESVAAIECVDFVAINDWPAAVETIKKLKQTLPGLYVMMLTNNEVDEREYEEIIRAGVDDYFLKPVSFNRILLHLEKGLKRAAC